MVVPHHQQQAPQPGRDEVPLPLEAGGGAHGQQTANPAIDQPGVRAQQRHGPQAEADPLHLARARGGADGLQRGRDIKVHVVVETPPQAAPSPEAWLLRLAAAAEIQDPDVVPLGRQVARQGGLLVQVEDDAAEAEAGAEHNWRGHVQPSSLRQIPAQRQAPAVLRGAEHDLVRLGIELEITAG